MAREGSLERSVKLLQAIAVKIYGVTEFPAIGTARPHLGSGIRSTVFDPYVIFYRSTKTELIVLRVIHGARET